MKHSITEAHKKLLIREYKSQVTKLRETIKFLELEISRMEKAGEFRIDSKIDYHDRGGEEYHEQRITE